MIKNILYIVFVLVLIGIFSVIVIYDKNRFEGNKKQYEDNIQLLENQKQQLMDQLKKMEEMTPSKSKECKYTQTFRYLDTYSYKGDVPFNNYIIVDRFQEFQPYLLEYDPNRIAINLEKNQFYEVTFQSLLSNGVENKKRVVALKKTDKLGLDQTQETCQY